MRHPLRRVIGLRFGQPTRRLSGENPMRRRALSSSKREIHDQFFDRRVAPGEDHADQRPFDVTQSLQKKLWDFKPGILREMVEGQAVVGIGAAE